MINLALSIIFAVEMLLKWVAIGLVRYFADAFNRASFSGSFLIFARLVLLAEHCPWLRTNCRFGLLYRAIMGPGNQHSIA